ncbi:small GTPase superfamily [Mycena latifolia]|nr:small GTPase superfamily [Mycena latifolia]
MDEKWSIALLGDTGVGKTALTYQFILNAFAETYDSILEEVCRKKWVVDETLCWMEVIDTAGSPEYASLQDQWIREGHGFFLVYSLTSRARFDRLDALWQSVRCIKGDKAPIILLANKCDNFLDRAISTEEAAALARHFRCPFLEVSAKTAQNVDRAFADLVRLIRQSRADVPARQVEKERKCVVL